MSGVWSADKARCGVQLSDEGLIQRAGSGEPAAWEAIVGRYRQAVFRYAYLQVGDAAEAEDVAQETFMRAFRSFSRFDRKRPLRPWLLRIARNVARNRWRGFSRRARAADRWKHEAAETVTAGAEVPVSLAETASELERVVARLNERDRQVIYLRFFLGLSLEETGEALALPLGTVKSRLSRALDRLRQRVVQEHPTLRRALEE
ncbi:MAG TPA: RNA polymerase sigma factor [Anaerolineales bacterium]|nr:RNA polymerase sigma factor [Anaerolineales bacterium]